ncbi:hypothetical protein YTPLAS18_21770 [Nitrospira sp.]|nr:hypothetical protein YTPLAS18_21770 [Nitrospira sp.]
MPLLWGRDMMYDRLDRFAVVACRSCGFLQSWPYLSPEALGRYYPESYFAPVRRTERPHEADCLLALGRRLYARLQRGDSCSRLACRVPPKWIDLALPSHAEPGLPAGRLLDVGSGSGRFLAGALSLGWHVEALDAGAKVDEVGQVLGIPAHQGTLDRIVGRLRPGFDLVSFNHVLEHVATPLETLKAARRLLSPGGVVRVQVPLWRPWCARLFGIYWSSLDLPRHRWHFRVEDIACLSRLAGFGRLLFLPETGTHILTSSVRLWLRHHPAWRRWESWASVDNRALRRATYPLGLAAALLRRPFEGTFYLMDGP